MALSLADLGGQHPSICYQLSALWTDHRLQTWNHATVHSVPFCNSDSSV